MRIATVLIAAALSASVAMAAKPASRTPRAVVEAMFAAVNRHDADALAALYSADALIISSDTCAPMRGAAAVRANHRALIAQLPDLRDEPTHWVVDDEQVAVLFTAHAANLPGGAIQLADFLTVRGGKIVRDVTIFNAGEPCK